MVEGLCSGENCEYVDVKSFYLNKFEKITGPSHLSELLIGEDAE